MIGVAIATKGIVGHDYIGLQPLDVVDHLMGQGGDGLLDKCIGMLIGWRIAHATIPIR